MAPRASGVTDISTPQRVWRLLSVAAEEQPKVVWAGATFFALMASASIGLNAADALFFLRFGVDTLPWMIMFSGVAVMITTIGYSAGLSRVGARRWFLVVTLVLAGWLGVERYAIAEDWAGTYPAVWLTGQIVMYVGLTLLWDVAGQLADPRQAKRLFPLFVSAGILGAVTGNALTGPLANLAGTENLLVIQAVGLAGVGLLARVTTVRFATPDGEAAEHVIAGLMAGFRTTVRVPLFRLVAGVGAAMSVLFFLVFFSFSEVVAESFPNEADLAGFLGLFSSVATAATFLMSLLGAKRLFTRAGVVAVLMITALVYVAGFSLWLVSFGLVTAVLFRGFQWVAVNALANTAFSSLFNVLTGRARAQTRDFVAAVPVQLGTVIGGAILLVGADLSHMGRTVVSLALAVAFLLLVIPMRRAYAAALVEAVRHGLSDVFTASLPGMQKPQYDADALTALAAELDDATPGRRRVIAAILCQVGGPVAEDRLRDMLGDEDEAVRLEALTSLEILESATLGDEAMQILPDPAISLRRKAISLLDGTRADAPAVVRALDDDDPHMRAHAARIVGGHRGRQVIDQMMESADPGAIAAAMKCVLAVPGLAHIDARPLAHHDDARVRALAAEMLAQRRDSVKTLLELHDDRSSDVRQAAATALTKVDRSATHDVLEHGSVRAREAALGALAAEEERDEYLHAWAASELDRAAELHRYRVAIDARLDGASVAAEYLGQVLEKRERMVERWVVTALATHDTRDAMPLVARGAISQDTETKAEALEAIESLADRALARRLVALLEEPDDTPLYRLQALQALAADHQYWFRALATRTMFDELIHDLRETAEIAATDDSPVVRSAIPVHTVSRPATDGAASVLDAVLTLRQAALFGGLDPEELEALAEVAHEKRFAPGETVYAEGTLSDELLVVAEGTVTIGGGSEGEEEIAAIRGPGEPVGELGLLRSAPRMADVVAGPDGLRAMVIPGSDFSDMLREHPAIATALLTTLADRIARVVDVTEADDLVSASADRSL